MDKLQKVFSYRGNKVRATTVDGKPWFVAADVCQVLDLGNVSQAVSRLDEDEKGIYSNDTPGGPQELLHVNEYGLYSLTLTSRKPEARSFKRWVTHEVLPQIRETGNYMAPKSPAEALLQAVTILAEQEKKIQLLEHRVNTLDNVNIIGDKRQQLNAMVKKYAWQNGYSFSKAWKDFIQAFNTAYRTNLTALKNNCPKPLSTPEYLMTAGRLDDAIRVADKMLNISRGA